jgi:hypothetical protein
MRRRWHRLPVLEKMLIIAIELVLLPVQIALTLPLMLLGIAAGIILCLVRPAWGEKTMSMPIIINDVLSRLRLRIARDPRVARYGNFR